jgi:glycosyltransferase involved in cell wall biosynthesis
MKILGVGTLPPHPGGSAISGGLLFAGFAAAGHAVRVLSPITAAARRSGDEFAARHPRLQITRFEVPYFESAPNLPATEVYRRVERDQIRTLLPALVNEQRPDIIFMGRETFAWDAPDIAQAYRLPCVLRTAGGTTFGILNGTLPTAEADRLLEQYRKVPLVVSPARHLAERLRQAGLRRIVVICNPVDLQRFAPRPKDPQLLHEWKIPDDAVVVAHVSNLKSLKRPLDFVASAAIGLRQNPRLFYLVVGDGSGRDAMERAAREGGMAERFRFVGWIAHDRMPDVINLADMVALPSADEAQARVYLETQACGRVIVASDIPAAREVIDDRTTGLLFRVGDPDDLAAKTLVAAGDASVRAAIGRHARARVEAHALSRVVQNYLTVFAAAIADHRASRQALFVGE